VLANFLKLILVVFVATTVVLAGSTVRACAISVVEFSHDHEVAHHDHHSHEHKDNSETSGDHNSGHQHSHGITVNAVQVIATLTLFAGVDLPEFKSNDPILGSTSSVPKDRSLGSIFRPPIV
jgi:hypothetical protein